MTRALSVLLGKGDVSWWASQPISVDGIDSRGNLAAWLSGPEKSRQWRQESGPLPCCVAGVQLDIGLDAWRAARSGLEAVGIGGGTASIASAGLLSSCLGCDGLPKPIVSADLFGGGGACTRLAGGSLCVSSDIGVACSCLTLVLAGSVGLPGN
jgi:hypothetical protein